MPWVAFLAIFEIAAHTKKVYAILTKLSLKVLYKYQISVIASQYEQSLRRDPSFPAVASAA